MASSDPPDSGTPRLPGFVSARRVLRDYRPPTARAQGVDFLATTRRTTTRTGSSAAPSIPSSDEYGIDFSSPPPDTPTSRNVQPGIVGRAATAVPRPAALAIPTPLLNFVGFESKVDEKTLPFAEKIDQTRYAKLEANISETGWLPWIQAAYEDEQTSRGNVTGNMTWDHWVRGCDYTLAGTVPEVLTILAKRESLAKAERSNDTLKAQLAQYKLMASQKFPSIYVRQLVVGPDQDDITVNQAKAIAMFIRQYANAESSKSDEHFKLDQMLRPDWKRSFTENGIRVLTHDKNQALSRAKKRVLQTFGFTIDKAAKEAEAQGHTHIPTMYYVGYAHDAAIRADQHAKKDAGTNGLFNLVEYLLEGWNLNPAPLMFPVCLVLTDTYAAIAEMFLCRLSQGYFYAGGYNQAPCGSVSSVWDITQAEWEDFRKMHDKDFGYVKRLEQELEKRTAFQRKPFDDENKRLEDKLDRLMARENELRSLHRELEEGLDLDFMRADPFLSQIIPLWEKVDTFVKSSPTERR